LLNGKQSFGVSFIDNSFMFDLTDKASIPNYGLVGTDKLIMPIGYLKKQIRVVVNLNKLNIQRE
jgi:hypothetical protein